MPTVGNSKDIEELINNLKSGIGLWEDLIAKSLKFSNSIKGMTMACSDLLDSMHTVCDIASKSSCGLRNTGISLTKLVLREKKMEMKVCGISNALSENLVGELDKYVNEWRRSSAVMKKDREHEWRRANMEYQKSLAECERTEKKLRKKNAGKVGLSETANLQLEYANQDALNKRRYVEELERCALRRAAIEERQRFKQFLLLLKPILDCQLSLREDLDNLEEVVAQLYGDKAENLDMLSEELEQNIQEHLVDCGNRSSIPSYSTLSKQQGSVSNGSRVSLNSNSMSTTSSEWNNNNVLMNTCMEVSARQNENMSNISHDSGIKSDKSFVVQCDMNPTKEHNWDISLTNDAATDDVNSLKVELNESDTDSSSTEDDNDASTDHNSQDGIIDNNNDLFLLPESHSNEEPPADYCDSLPPPPPPPPLKRVITAPETPQQSQYSSSFNYQRDTLYPNQSIPCPIYSNLQELKINAAKKFGANTLSRPSFKERGQIVEMCINNNEKPKEEGSTSFLSGTEKNKSIPSSLHQWGIVELKDPELVTLSSTSMYANSNEDAMLNFVNLTEQNANTLNHSRIPQKGDASVKCSTIRRGSFATEMQLPQTPKTANSIRRPSVQEKAPLNMYSNRNRGRSMSVTRESNCAQECQEQTSEDFNTIRERIETRINYELKPPTVQRTDVPKAQSPSTNYMSYDSSRTLSSPVAIRSSRYYSERISKQSQQSSTQNPQMRYQQPMVPGSQNQDMEFAAGEETANNDFNLSNTELYPMTASRKGDPFKKQLMQVLHTPKSQEVAKTQQTQPGLQSQALSSFCKSMVPPSAAGHRSQPVYGKSKSKSSIPNSKYHY